MSKPLLSMGLSAELDSILIRCDDRVEEIAVLSEVKGIPGSRTRVSSLDHRFVLSIAKRC